MLLFIYIVYLKWNYDRTKVYVGRTSGQVKEASVSEIGKVLRKRDSNHAMNDTNFLPAEIRHISTNANAVRGQEQILIEKYRELDISANKINGISPKNPKKWIYLTAALETFGESLAIFLAFTV